MRTLLFYLFALFTVISVWGNDKAEVCNVSSFLNVRLQPDINSQKIAKLEKGAQVEIIGENNTEWVCIESDGVRGYVKAKYLKNISSPQKSIESFFTDIWHWYVKVFWKTDGFWGVVLAILGVVVLSFALLVLFYAFGILLHGIVGAVIITIIGAVLSLLGLIDWRMANELYVYGFYAGLAVGVIRLFINHDGFLSIFDGAEDSGTKAFQGKKFTGSDENGYPITLEQTSKYSEIDYHDPDTGEHYEKDPFDNFRRR